MQELGPVGAFKTSKLPDGTQIVAPIPASVVRPSGATFAADELLQVGIELEIAFRIERGLPSPDAEDFEDKLRSCVVALPVIEVVDTRLAFLETCHPMMKLADNQSNGGLVIGQPVADWQERNVATPDHHFAAGDTVISVVTLALAADLSIAEGVYLANYAAGLVVRKLGNATPTQEELAWAIKNWPTSEL